jgi:LysM repeat protein
MGRRTLTISVAVLALVGAVAGAVNPPPQPLHKVGDHWTPYQPPAEFPSDAQVYIITPGDTLWDLAKRFLGDPYLWPQIWEQNKYITDAHWIYPGDPLVIQIKAAEAPPAEAPREEAPPPPEPTPAPPVEEAAPEEGLANLVLAGSEDDVYCFAFLDEINVAPQFVVASGEQIQYQDTFATGDILYVSGGDAEGVKAGQEFFLVSPGPKLRHPATRAVLGRVMRYVGHLRVLCAQEHTATAEVLSACDPIETGTWLKPFEPIPIPMIAMTPMTDRCEVPNDKPKGFIVYSKDEIVTFGQDHDVIIDLGEADQVSPGTVCTIYRENPVEGMPRILLGEAAVLTTGEHWATAKIIRSNFPMSVGDRVEVK